MSESQENKQLYGQSFEGIIQENYIPYTSSGYNGPLISKDQQKGGVHHDSKK